MNYKIFTYPIPAPENPEDLNGFLSSAKVTSVQSHMVCKQDIPFLVFVVEYLESAAKDAKPKPKVDYREKLSDEDFHFFSQLRDLRKSLAEKEGIPVYAVFTNAQLAQIVAMRITSKQGLESIHGVGKSKIDRYGQAFIKLCLEQFSNNAQANEKNMEHQ